MLTTPAFQINKKEFLTLWLKNYMKKLILDISRCQD